MASRDIANMHLFLEMKKKFPDLAEDTIRNYVFHCANDKDKCTELLLKESKNHFHSGPQFSEPRLPDTSLSESEHNRSPKTPENKVHIASSSIPHTSEDMNIGQTTPRHAEYLPPNPPPYHQLQFDTGEQSRTHAGIVWSQSKPEENFSMPKKSAQSAPVMASHERPFTDIYKYVPISSHNELYPTSDRMMFSTTKEHIISPPTSSTVDLAPFSALPHNSEAKRQSVQLSITPAFPLQQPQYGYNSSVCAATSHSSKPGRHTTSLNFQIQPPSADQYPLEISTIPEGIGQPCNFRDFGSHVQVSVGPQGSTFTAFRVQRPQNQPETQYSTKPLSPRLTSSSKLREPSHMPKTKIQGFSAEHRQGPLIRGSLAEISEVQANSGFGIKDSFSPEIVFSQPGTSFTPIYTQNVQSGKNTQVSRAHGYQQSQAYKQDVINHQKAILDLLLHELKNEKYNCSKLEAEVNKMEQAFQERSAKTSFPFMAELKKLREENRKLLIECNSLFTQTDSASMAVPLWDSDQDFYSNIFTGPSGAITSQSKRHSPRLKKQSSSSSSSSTKKQVPDEPKKDDEDEGNQWSCKKCSFFNHPALEKCEICDIPKSHGSFFDDE